MKTLLATIATLSAAPALAHSGAHMHPHASDPSWVPLLLAMASAAAAFLWMRGK
ncbi:peptidase M23 [Shimia thalassica]|uniref:peptidase M23 n=1 Tax=Shimia thalassica TaxID=1715693 RepID=UPI0026E22C07|nr:peptidase M23 [Shimia thalassica]MDO6522798.1 peptidase M23 [Shimia thalassica]